MKESTSRRSRLSRSILVLIASVCIVTFAIASPIPSGIDSYATQLASFNFQIMPIPGGFFGPGSDAFADYINFQSQPIGTGTTDTQVQRPNKASFPHPFPSNGTASAQIIALSLTSKAPITVTYNGGSNAESWDVHAGLTPVTQPVGSMTFTDETTEGGEFDADLPVLVRLTFTRVSDGTVRVYDLPSLDFRASFVPWTHRTKDTTIIHAKNFCPACDLPNGVPADMFMSAFGVQIDLLPARI